MPRTTSTLTISLPPAMLEELERVRKREHRTRSELMREALRTYMAIRSREATPSTSERRAISRGRAAIARGDYVTVDGIRNDAAAAPRRSRKKGI